MRYRLMASFQGASYQAGVGPSDEEVTLFAACPPPEELGFRSSSGHWRKRVSVAEIDALWESRPIGRYRGERCMVLDDLGDRMHIAYLGRDLYMARRLGFWEVDRGVFEVVVPRQEVDDLREEPGEYELAVLDPADGSLPGSWDGSPRETWASIPRDSGYAPDTGPLRSPVASPPRDLVDTGPSWAADARGPAGPGGWDDSGWDMRDDHAQDPRDTGTWAALRELDRQDLPEPGGPFPRGRGGWRARDTGGWEAPDTGGWDAPEVAERAAREAHDRRTTLAPRTTGGWSAREIADAAAREARATGGWSAREVAAAPQDARAALAPRNTGGWSARDVADAAMRGAWEDGSWDARGNVDWGGREDGGWDARGVATGGQREAADRWDPQDAVAWNPVSAGEWEPPAAARWSSRPASPGRVSPAHPSPAHPSPAHARPPAEPDTRPMAGWEPGKVMRPSNHQRTPDAAAVWHGSPSPEDAGRWGPPAPH